LQDEALRALGLPVRIAASGWLDAQPVLVARYALAFVADPTDSHAALVYLSLGPACLLPDQSLALLTSGGLHEHEGLDQLRVLADRAREWSVTELAAQVCRHLRDWAEALPQPSQALADLAKLEALATDFDAAEPGMHEAAGLYGRGPKVFLAWLETQRASREFNRHPDPGVDAAPGIEVVTWHSSKGREWPVTVVCELDKDIYEWPNTTRAVFSDFSDLTNVLDKATLEHTPNCPVPELQHRMAQDRQAAAEDDARNLIYVVLTRARDRLVIEWIGGALDRDPITCLGLLARDARMSVDSTGLHAMDQNFAATVYDNPAGNGRDPMASPALPYRSFGTISPAAASVFGINSPPVNSTSPNRCCRPSR
jgi:ATP-dependent exoDNAse (exonuclease V) beta subunit